MRRRRDLLNKQSLWHLAIPGALFFVFLSFATADDNVSHAPAPPPRIAIIIDDVGTRLHDGVRAMALPGPVTYAIIPFTPFATRLAYLAHTQFKDVMVHMPMQPMGDYPPHTGLLTLDMTRQAFVNMVEKSLHAIPYAIGVNNHMGSLLTQHPGHMKWFMKTLKQQPGWFFIDSRTTHKTIAGQIAAEQHIPAITRDVFLDHVQSTAQIERQFDRLLERARQNGFALAIGHPYPETLDVLEKRLPLLQRDGVQLISVASLFAKPSESQPRLVKAASALRQGDAVTSELTVYQHSDAGSELQP